MSQGQSGLPSRNRLMQRILSNDRIEVLVQLEPRSGKNTPTLIGGTHLMSAQADRPMLLHQFGLAAIHPAADLAKERRGLFTQLVSR